MLEIISACRLEDLFRAFEARLDAHKPDAMLAPDTLLVPNRDLARWLQIRRARCSGVSANLRAVLPARFMHELNLQVNPSYEEQLPDKHALAWMIFSALRELQAGAQTASVWKPLLAYIRKSGAEMERVRRYELSANIADIFDEYQLFRPEWIQAWNRGEAAEVPALFTQTADWQRQLWSALKAKNPGMTDRARLNDALMDAIGAGQLRLPHALHVFGTAPFPPLYLRAILGLSRHIPVLFYRVQPEGEAASGTAHPMMTAMGAEHRQYSELLEQLTAGLQTKSFFQPGSPSPETQTPESETLLQWVQASVRERDLRELPADLPAGDRSLLAHACHSAMREVEVLHDRIIRFLDDNPDAGPSDVLVVAPQLSDHLTAIRAVFGHPSDEALRLPWFLHDPAGSPLVRATDLLMQLLRLDETRFRADVLLEMLDRPLLRERLGLGDDDLRLIAFWVRETGIRWGLDAEDREDAGLFSWEFGLDRLLLGLMMPAETEEPVLGLMPFPHIEGEGQLRVAGQLAGFVETLARWVKQSREPKPLHDWPELIRQLMVEVFPLTPDTERMLRPLFAAVDRLPQMEQWTCDENLPAEVIAQAVGAQIREQTAGAGYRKGSVTFSTMVPVRHMPFRFIAMLGLNEGSFPGREEVSGFNLMARSPKPGDRVKRLSNRALFLDALMACRQQLHLSYVGFSFRDGSERAPSLVLRELWDMLRQQGLSKPEEQLLVKHRLHGHHPAYFAQGPDSGLFSYDASRIEALRLGQFAAVSGDAQRRFDQPLPAPEADSLLVVELHELMGFVQKPVGWMMQHRANMARLREEELPPRRDPFALNKLEEYLLKDRMLRHTGLQPGTEQPESEQVQPLRTRLALEARLPYSKSGERAFDANWEDLQSFLEEIPVGHRELAAQPGVLAEVELEVSGRMVLVRGLVPPVIDGESVTIEHGKMKAKRKLKAWLRQLLVQAALDENATGYTYGPDEDDKKPAFELCLRARNPKEQLTKLIAIWLNCHELPPPATPEFLERLDKLRQSESEKGAVSKLAAYFRENPNSYSTLPNDDPWAAQFYPEYQDELPDLAAPFYEAIWLPFEASIVDKD